VASLCHFTYHYCGIFQFEPDKRLLYYYITAELSFNGKSRDADLNVTDGVLTLYE